MDIIKQMTPPIIWNTLKKIKNNFTSEDNRNLLQVEINKEEERLKSFPRFVETETLLLNHKIKIVDSASYQSIEKELFDNEIYKFISNNDQPYIIDCGANIGLSVIYFKQLFPNAEIVAFEPDEKVFNVLKYNIDAFQLSNVRLVKMACWHEETTLKFYSQGADAGRSAIPSDTGNIIEVKATRLREYLNRKVDFLKIDIEGAEANVLADCADVLTNVERIFVEYHSFINSEQELPEILSILKEAGFRLHVSAPAVFSQRPFVELYIYANMDNQLNIYGSRC